MRKKRGIYLSVSNRINLHLIIIFIIFMVLAIFSLEQDQLTAFSPGECGGTDPGADDYILCECGDTITRDYVMKEDLFDCSGDGLFVQRDLTIDCAGFRVRGTATPLDSVFGISTVRKGHDVTIRNCHVSGFNVGIRIHFARFVSVENSDIGPNVRNGITSVGFYGESIVNNKIHDNGWNGIYFDETWRSTIENNEIYNNDMGIDFIPLREITDEGHLRVSDHTIRFNSIYNNTKKRNLVRSGSAINIRGPNSLIEGNTFARNRIGLIIEPLYSPSLDSLVSSGNIYLNNVLIENERNLDFESFLSDRWDYSKFSDEFLGNTFDGKAIVWENGLNGDVFDGLDLAAFVCVSCKDILITNSQIQDLYFLNTNDSVVRLSYSDNGDRGVTLFHSHNNDIEMTITENSRPILERKSTGNIIREVPIVCEDNDGDGYDLCDESDDGKVPDCDDTKAQVHPGAVEECNLIDDNCNGEVDESMNLCVSENQCITGVCTQLGECVFDDSQCELGDFNCTDVDEDGVLDFDAVDCPIGKDQSGCILRRDTIDAREFENLLPESKLFGLNWTRSRVDDPRLLRNLTLEDSTRGSITFLGGHDFVRVRGEDGCFARIQFDQVMTIENGRIVLNTGLIPILDKRARLTFRSVSFLDPKILWDGADCDDCSEVSYNNGGFCGGCAWI